MRSAQPSPPPRPFVLALAGSASSRSRSTVMLRCAANLLRERGVAVQEVGLHDFPPSDLIEAVHDEGSAARWLRDLVARAGGLVVASPVYQASFSAALKAMLDLLPERALQGKAVLPLGSAGSTAHLLALEYSLNPVLSALGARHILAGVYAAGEDVTWNAEGDAVLGDRLGTRLNACVERLLEFVVPVRAPLRAADIGHLLVSARFGV
ncbi:NADPH-dependent FMN reductase [Verticiella sediminum]|uniref:NADPH-dependent FMN reductase n=2 Tax=Verticiella sediminum TaxID=1247510 RepID=A0A556A5X1_9BURK|nr:NADPH-dependent FMN reductase [Verticiella sediminum]TSH88254.1 NADPH-dependent FMN reductase [Verticiella sediminum]